MQRSGRRGGLAEGRPPAGSPGRRGAACGASAAQPCGNAGAGPPVDPAVGVGRESRQLPLRLGARSGDEERRGKGGPGSRGESWRDAKRKLERPKLRSMSSTYTSSGRRAVPGVGLVQSPSRPRRLDGQKGRRAAVPSTAQIKLRPQKASDRRDATDASQRPGRGKPELLGPRQGKATPQGGSTDLLEGKQAAEGDLPSPAPTPKEPLRSLRPWTHWAGPTRFPSPNAACGSPEGSEKVGRKEFGLGILQNSPPADRRRSRRAAEAVFGRAAPRKLLQLTIRALLTSRRALEL